MKAELHQRALEFDAAEYRNRKTPSLTELANSNMQIAKETKTDTPATLYNPYEGNFCGRQLSETVDEFLHRLPPATTKQSNLVHWIFIANPFRKAPKRDEDAGKDVSEEGPPDEESDWARFVVLGGNLLEELTTMRHNIEKQKSGAAKATITKALNPQRNKIVQKLLDTAVECGCTSGKVCLLNHPIWNSLR